MSATDFSKSPFEEILFVSSATAIGALEQRVEIELAQFRASARAAREGCVGPERARRQFTALIDQARSSIRVNDAKLSDPELVSVLKARRASGLTVEVFAQPAAGRSQITW